MEQFLAMDEEGYFILPPETRLTDEATGYILLKNLKVEANGSIITKWADSDEKHTIVEPFDKPLICKQVFKNGSTFSLLFPYGFQRDMITSTLVLDGWDRFHGLTEDRVPFVMSRAAQAEFFNLLDEYTDDTITIDGKEQAVPAFYLANSEMDTPSFWRKSYSDDGVTPWDLGGPHPAIESILPQIKIVKSRIANFGCGRGHDAAFLAKKGHVVTGFDLSEDAINDAKKMYGNIPSLSFEQADVFKPVAENAKYDVIFEHTLFCAIPPELRKNLVQRWRQSLDMGGYLLGIFFVMPSRGGPPYGCSEWELRSHLEKHFRLLYWKRWEHLPERRLGTELIVFAQKL